MEQQESSEEQLPPENQALMEVIQRLEELAAASLRSAIRHTEVWRRAQHTVRSEDVVTMYDRLRSMALDVLVHGHHDLDTNDMLQGISICVEEFDYTKYPDMGGAVERHLLLSFHYGSGQSDAKDICIDMKIGEPHVVSYVCDHKAMETGYEGHDHQYWELSVPELQELHAIVDAQLRDITQSAL